MYFLRQWKFATVYKKNSKRCRNSSKTRSYTINFKWQRAFKYEASNSDVTCSWCDQFIFNWKKIERVCFYQCPVRRSNGYSLFCNFNWSRCNYSKSISSFWQLISKVWKEIVWKIQFWWVCWKVHQVGKCRTSKNNV